MKRIAGCLRRLQVYALLIAAVLFTNCASANANGTVVPVPAIPDTPASALYIVKVNGQDVAVNDESRYDFHTAAFTMSGTVTVEITATDDVKSWTVRPLRHKITPALNGKTITFSLSSPLKLVVQAGDKMPLALLATPLETKVPKEGDPDVIYFGPGAHEPGVIQPRSGQTIYLAPGALVKGRIEAREVKNVAVRGRGILNSDGYSIRKEKTAGILFHKSSNITVEGIGHRSGTWWQSLFLLTDDVEVSHMNLFGKTVNTDGIDIDGVKRLVARHCFIRCEDDGFGWHALDAKANGEPVTEDCLAEDCVIWNTSAGNGLRVGASMETQLFQNITFRNIDVLQHAGAAIYSDHSDWAWCKNIRFENFVDETSKQTIGIIIAKTRYSNNTGYKDERGHYDGLHFINVTSPGGKIELKGYDENHLIDNVTFQNCTIGDNLIDSMDDITANAFVRNVSFNKPVTP
ncbi:MAG: hypothetical protein M3347_05465 [Armatimonadota bacterium]|nr:hypothetical protein [Armatimonadota bacterium]